MKGRSTLAAVLTAIGPSLIVAGCGATKTVTRTVTVTASAKSGLGAPSERVEFGYVRSLKLKGDHYVLRFDPAWFLSGVTANTAAAEDGAVSPGEPVPNDNYTLDEGHRLLTYLVPTTAHVTVLTRGGDPSQLGATPITVSELARIVDGNGRLDLFEPITTGFWIRFRIDTVRALDQQYRP